MRDLVVLLRAATALGVAMFLCACGTTKLRPAAPVKLDLSSPPDDSRIAASTATVVGVVSPRTARVLVTGRTVKTGRAGEFSMTVALVPGTNLIDVIASAPHARPAMTSLRVIRYVLIAVPDVTGESPGKAAATISRAGLQPRLRGDGNPLSFLLPLPQQVCVESPGAGSRVGPGTAVMLQLGKVCT